MKNNQIIIIGGGNSINLFPPSIWGILSKKFTLGCNFSYKDVTPTALCTVDHDFYSGYCAYDETVKLWNKLNVDHYNKLRKLPLVIASKTTINEENRLSNSILLKTHSHTWNREKSLSKGFYVHSLTGHFTLSVACFLLDFKGDIFLLGFDANTSEKTHYYTHTQHRGIGYLDYYQAKENDLNELFLPYSEERDINIYNVSMNSEIDIFKKITPNSMLMKIEGNDYNQNELRELIKTKLTI